MFHVELRQFPHVARAFNLNREQLDARFLVPWVKGQLIDLEDRRWAPHRAKIAIYEGPQLRPDEIGLGRGWANVMRGGTEVSEKLIEELEAAVPIGEVKRVLEERCAQGPCRLAEVVTLVEDRREGMRASTRLALAEQAVWELLHQQRLTLTRADAVLPAEEWEAVLLDWDSWTEGDLELQAAD